MTEQGPVVGIGIRCRRCGCTHFYTDSTRREQDAIIRLRHCRHCGKRMTTRERAIGDK